MTSVQHQSVTVRLAEFCEIMQWQVEDIVVNLQGDEPVTPPELLQQVATNLHDFQDCAIATLTTPIEEKYEIDDPNIVKVVSDINGYALYFSRAAIPYKREVNEPTAENQYFRHLGIYAYRVEFLNNYNKMPQCPLETIEKLEQLRAMYHGYKIHTQQAVKLPGPGIDTPEDLQKVNALITQ